MFNHATKENVGYKIEDGYYTMRTKEPIAKGQSINISYGDLTNFRSLDDYGFYQAPAHAITCTRLSLNTNLPMQERKYQILQLLDEEPEKTFWLKMDYNDPET